MERTWPGPLMTNQVGPLISLPHAGTCHFCCCGEAADPVYGLGSLGAAGIHFPFDFHCTSEGDAVTHLRNISDL